MDTDAQAVVVLDHGTQRGFQDPDVQWSVDTEGRLEGVWLDTGVGEVVGVLTE